MNSFQRHVVNMAELNEGRHKTCHCSGMSLMACINTIARPGRIKSALYELAYACKPQI